jgi:tetratricopeptide (TPR) repeat protein
MALTFRGDTLRESGNNEGAVKDFNDALLISPEFLAALTGRGWAYEKMGNFAKARADFERALSLAPAPDGFSKPAQDLAQTRLAALPKQSESLPKPEPAKLVIPEDIAKQMRGRGHALLIGVSDYTSGWDKLPNVKSDLEDLKAGLAPYFEMVDIELNPTVAKLQ